jgi:hypothetical protein
MLRSAARHGTRPRVLARMRCGRRRQPCRLEACWPLADRRRSARMSAEYGRGVGVVRLGQHGNSRAGGRRQQMQHLAGGEQRVVVKQDAVAAAFGGISRAIRRSRMPGSCQMVGAAVVRAVHGPRHRHAARNGRHHDNKQHGQHRQPGYELTRGPSLQHQNSRGASAYSAPQSNMSRTVTPSVRHGVARVACAARRGAHFNGTEASNSARPSQSSCTPMQKITKANSRMATWVPTVPSSRSRSPAKRTQT